MKDKLVVFVDENDQGDFTPLQWGILKKMITEPDISLEGKGQDTIQVKNYLNFLLTMNGTPHPKSKVDTENRRLIIITHDHVDKEKLCELRKQKQLLEQSEDEGIGEYENLLRYLQSIRNEQIQNEILYGTITTKDELALIGLDCVNYENEV